MERIVHCKLNEGDWGPPDLCNGGSQENCQRSLPPCNSKYHLVMATAMFPLTIHFLPQVSFSPVLRLFFFCPRKAILQVKAGHLEACGLAVSRCVVSPYTRTRPRDWGPGAIEAPGGWSPALRGHF